MLSRSSDFDLRKKVVYELYALFWIVSMTKSCILNSIL